MILDQVEEELAPLRLRRIPRGRQGGADPAPAGGTLVLRLVLEARHMPIDLAAQVGKGLAQDRLEVSIGGGRGGLGGVAGGGLGRQGDGLQQLAAAGWLGVCAGLGHAI